MKRVNGRHTHDAGRQPAVQARALAVRMHEAHTVAANHPDELQHRDRIQPVGPGLHHGCRDGTESLEQDTVARSRHHEAPAAATQSGRQREHVLRAAARLCGDENL